MTYITSPIRPIRTVQCDFQDYTNDGVNSLVTRYLIPATAMNLQVKDGYEIKIWGTWAANSAAKNFAIGFGGEETGWGLITSAVRNNSTTAAMSGYSWEAKVKVVKYSSTHFVLASFVDSSIQDAASTQASNGGVNHTYVAFSGDYFNDWYVSVRDYTTPKTAAGNIIVRGMTTTLIPGK